MVRVQVQITKCLDKKEHQPFLTLGYRLRLNVCKTEHMKKPTKRLIWKWVFVCMFEFH